MAVVSRPPADNEKLESPSPWIVPVLTLAAFIAMLNTLALGPFLPVMSEDLNASVALLGQIPALTMLLATLLGLVIGPIADQIGHRRALLGSLLIAVISSLGIGLAPGYLLLLMAALIGAVGRAVIAPVAVVIVGALFRGDQQRRAVSWVMGGTAGAVIAGIPAMTTIAQSFGWRVAFDVLAGATVLLVGLTYRILAPDKIHDTTRPSIDSVLSAYQPLVHHRPTVALIGSNLLFTVGIWVMATYLGAFYSDRYEYTIQQIGWVYLVIGTTLFIGSLAVGGRLGAFPLRPLVVGSRIFGGLAIGAVLIVSLPAMVGIGLLAVVGAAAGISAVVVTLLLMRMSPAGRVTTLTLNTAALSLGIALGSALGGLLLAVAGFWLIGLCALLLSFASAGLVWWSQERTIYVVPIPSPKPPV